MRSVLGVLVVAAVIAGRAYAQSSDSSATAEQLFNQARELAKADNWSEACPKFEASLRYAPVLGTRLNLATCYEHIGKLASAWGLYRESIDLAKKAGDIKRRDYAQKQAAALEPRLAKLAISVPAKPPAGFVVTRDGTTVDAGALGVALYIDTGPHEISALAPGFEAFTKNITLTEGETETLAIPDLKPAPIQASNLPKPPAGDPVMTNEPAVEQSSSHKDGVTNKPAVLPSSARRYTAIGVGAAGVVTVSIGLLFGVKANSTYGDAKKLCGQNLVCGPADYDKGKQLISDTRSNATVSTVLVAAGGAAMIAGVIAILTAPRAHEHMTARIEPVIQGRGAGLALLGRF